MNNHDFEVEILVRGRPVQVFIHHGEFYIEGRQGSVYELKVYNNTWSRAEVVASVDGMSIVEDGPAGPHNSGYVIPSRSSITIPGFRRNNNAVAEFVFADKKNSYAIAMGARMYNVGVIGFMFFKEKQEYFTREPVYTIPNSVYSNHITNNTIASSNATLYNVSRSINEITDANNFDLGTNWGNEIQHNVQDVQFTRENPHHPNKIITVYYDSRRGLEARGIQVVRSTSRPTHEKPNPFPGYTEKGCSAPPGWFKTEK